MQCRALSELTFFSISRIPNYHNTNFFILVISLARSVSTETPKLNKIAAAASPRKNKTKQKTPWKALQHSFTSHKNRKMCRKVWEYCSVDITSLYKSLMDAASTQADSYCFQMCIYITYIYIYVTYKLEGTQSFCNNSFLFSKLSIYREKIQNKLPFAVQSRGNDEMEAG